MQKEKNKAMKAYLDEIGTTDLLTDEQERALAMRISEGDPRAAGELATANLRFVLSLANQYKGQGVDYDDLVSEGNIGLLKAASRFNPLVGKRFVTFAAPIVRSAMEHFIEKHSGLYKVPRMEATNAEMRRSHPVSVDAPIPAGSKNNFSLLNLLVNASSPLADSAFLLADDEEYLKRLLARLDEREQQVMKLVYGVGSDRHTFAETACLMGLKRERVRQIRDKALRKLRKALRQTGG